MSGLATVATPYTWIGFVALIVGLLALDLGLLQRKARTVSPQRAALASAAWILLAVCFGAGIAVAHGRKVGLEFASGYLLEKALAVDNLFVIALLFDHFRVPARHQYRVLYWGILGALIARGTFIGLGTALIARFSWVLYVFGAVLLVTGLKVALSGGDAPATEEGVIVRWARRVLPLTKRLRSSAFWVVERHHLKATPLMLALFTIEVSDVVFALDSIPAIFAITADPFIVFSSNICAVLGMRSLYFLLAHVITRFRYLKFGLAGVLCFVGLRLLLARWVEIPILVSFAVIVALIGGAAAFSWLDARDAGRRRTRPRPRAHAR